MHTDRLPTCCVRSPASAIVRRVGATALVLLISAVVASGSDRPWRSPHRFRLLLSVEARDIERSNSPSSLEIDFTCQLQVHHIDRTFDEHKIEVLAYERSDARRVSDRSRRGNPRRRSGLVGDGDYFREA